MADEITGGYREEYEYQYPIERAFDIVSQLSDLWDDVAEKIGVERGKFTEQVFDGMYASGATGAEEELNFAMHMDFAKDMRQIGILLSAHVACGYAIDAIRAQIAEDELRSWRFVSRADYWLGVSIGSWAIRRQKELSATDFARRGATGRHAENRAMKAEVHKWCEAQLSKFKSMDSAAEAVAGKVVPVKFRTAREWIAEWKKTRSAGTP